MRLRRILPVLATLTAVAGIAAAANDGSFRLFAADRNQLRVRAPGPSEAPLVRIQEEGREAVAALNEAARTETDPVRIREIQAEIIAAKTATRLRFLEALAASAAARGDLRVRDEAIRQIDLIRNPPAVVVEAPHRPSPDKDGLLRHDAGDRP